MSKRGKDQGHGKRSARSRRRLIVGGIALMAVAGFLGLWLGLGPKEASGGTPRLTVDRTVVDLGYLRFDTPARVVFTLANAGDGLLRLTEVPRVRAVAGC